MKVTFTKEQLKILKEINATPSSYKIDGIEKKFNSLLEIYKFCKREPKMTKKMITSSKPYPTRKEIIEDLSTLDDGIHQMWDDRNRLYQGIVKDKKVLFYVTPLGVIYQDNGFTKDLEQDFKEIGGLSSPDDFKTIAKFNKWV